MQLFVQVVEKQISLTVVETLLKYEVSTKVGRAVALSVYVATVEPVSVQYHQHYLYL